MVARRAGCHGAGTRAARDGPGFWLAVPLSLGRANRHEPSDQDGWWRPEPALLLLPDAVNVPAAGSAGLPVRGRPSAAPVPVGCRVRRHISHRFDALIHGGTGTGGRPPCGPRP